jgi:sulfur relay (sulfurtransferase) DsrC/TusE family protein
MQTHNSNDETPRKNDKDTTKKNNSDVNIEQNQTQQKKSRKLTQITNWNLKIISKLSELKNIEKGLLSNTLVKACQGRYDHSNNTSNPSLHMIIKFVKQMSKLGVKKIITALAENTVDTYI